MNEAALNAAAADADAQPDADAEAAARVLAVRPELVALERAGPQLALGDRELLHAGPPLADPTAPCIPILNSAITAALLEGWAQTAEEARQMVRGGQIKFRPAQDAGCVVPLADVLSPSMWVQVVRDAVSPARWACSPLNAGAAHAMRVGVFDNKVLGQLWWLDEHFAPAYRDALAEPVGLIDIADQGLAAGDDCHGKTPAATRVLAALLHDRFTGPDAQACRAFLADSPGFFLNLWMAASRCMLSAAAGVAHSGVVTAAAGNGEHFGIQVAGLPGRWFTAPAQAPRMVMATGEMARSSLGAIGDSAIVDLLGFGAMTTLDTGAQDAPAFAALWPQDSAAPRDILHASHPAFQRTGARVVTSTHHVRKAAKTPVVSLGVLDKAGYKGRLGAGFYRVPMELFAAADKALGQEN